MFNFFSHFFRGYRIDYYTEDEMLGGEMHLVDMLSIKCKAKSDSVKRELSVRSRYATGAIALWYIVVKSSPAPFNQKRVVTFILSQKTSFLNHLVLRFQNESVQNLSYENNSDLHENKLVGGTIFKLIVTHENSGLTQRHKVTSQWPIHLLFTAVSINQDTNKYNNC